MPQSANRARNQTVEEPFLGVLQQLRADRDPRLPIVLKTANLNGWTYKALGDVIGVTRERVRQLIGDARFDPSMILPDVPIAPRRVLPKPKTPRPVLRIKPEIADRLYEMWAVASKVNGGTPADAPERQISIEYTSLLASLVEQGVTIGEIARTIGIEQSGIKARLARHGYREASPSQVHHKYKGTPTGGGSPREVCKWGHELSGSNLRLVSTTGAHVCRTCERRRSGEYQARKRAEAGLGAPRKYTRRT